MVDPNTGQIAEGLPPSAILTVPTRPWSADALPGVIAVQDFAVRRAGVLTPAVRMTDEACRRSSAGQCHV